MQRPPTDSEDTKADTNTTWKAIEPLLDQLLELDPGAQSTYLDNLTAENAVLARQLSELLAAEEPDAQIRQRLEPLIERAMDSLDHNQTTDGRVGPWQVGKEIGRGGMGRVYRATRADGQYQQTVALKVMSERIGDRLARRRFLNERQILARLAHPNVAQLVDGGVLEDGRPYFAMEMVRGAPILEFADQYHLDLAARVALLIQLCRGVEYAHRNLIIHRDIKPSNVLVSRTSFAGTDPGQADALDLVKLLDFGVAKMTDPDGTTTLQTLGSLRPITFEYASPEQIRGEEVTIASDLYSLTLVGYELICGRCPVEVRPESLNSIAEVAKTNLASPLASNRFSDLSNDRQKTVAELRSTTPKRLLRALRTDLDYILATGLSKQPENRYRSVIDLRRDLERFLQGSPVQARTGSGYHLRKFAANNRLILLAALVMTIAVGASAAGLLHKARLARMERDQALAARATAEDFNQVLLASVFDAVLEKTLADGTTLEQLLEQRIQLLDQQAASQPTERAALRGAIGELYLQLERPADAEPYLRQALVLAQEAGSSAAIKQAERQLSQLVEVRRRLSQAKVSP